MISEKEIKHIAKLARLGLEEKEIKELKEELSRILDYIEKLKKLDVSKVKPTSHPFFLKNVMRKDEAKKFEKKEDLFLSAPCLEKGYFKVKKIL